VTHASLESLNCAFLTYTWMRMLAMIDGKKNH